MVYAVSIPSESQRKEYGVGTWGDEDGSDLCDFSQRAEMFLRQPQIVVGDGAVFF